MVIVMDMSSGKRMDTAAGDANAYGTLEIVANARSTVPTDCRLAPRGDQVPSGGWYEVPAVAPRLALVNFGLESEQGGKFRR